MCVCVHQLIGDNGTTLQAHWSYGDICQQVDRLVGRDGTGSVGEGTGGVGEGIIISPIRVSQSKM